jgi:hypothetical protein
MTVPLVTGQFSRMVTIGQLPQHSGSHICYVVDPGKIFTNTPGMTLEKTPDESPCLKHPEMAHCSRVWPQ